ncbi:MAG: inorganic diphosphatase, partial [Acidimicrobiales bacterium]|nr:inorganic diphosphatase [Acidimicrobiales bacterium]
GPDTKVLCVPATDPRVDSISTIADVPQHELDEIAHFFDIYKSLEPGKGTEVEGWQDLGAAESEIAEAMRRFQTA